MDFFEKNEQKKKNILVGALHFFPIKCMLILKQMGMLRISQQFSLSFALVIVTPPA